MSKNGHMACKAGVAVCWSVFHKVELCHSVFCEQKTMGGDWGAHVGGSTNSLIVCFVCSYQLCCFLVTVPADALYMSDYSYLDTSLVPSPHLARRGSGDIRLIPRALLKIHSLLYA